MSLVLQILFSIFSGLIGSMVTLFYQKYLNTLKMKRNVVEQLFAYKYQCTGTKIPANSVNVSHEFANALNSIPIVFNGDKNVRQKYDDFCDALSSSNRDENQTNTKLLNLLKEVCKAAKLDCKNWNDERFTRAINI